MKAKLNKVKTVKRISRSARVPPGRVIASRKDKRKHAGRSAWRHELRARMADGSDANGGGR